ncbi:hypothetical protein Tco_0204787, partial [Tanacetum coccineum]
AGDGIAGIKRRCRDLSSDGVRNMATASGRGRLKEDLESSMWRRLIHADISILSSEVPVIPPIAPEAEEAVVALPAGVLDMIIHSSSESDPSEDPSSPEHAPIVPSTSLLLFSDSSKTFGDYSDSDSSERPPSHDPCEAAVTRWRSKVAVRLSSPELSSSSPSTLVLPSTPVEATIAPSTAIASSTAIAPSTVVAPHQVHTSPICDTKALVTEISPVPHVVCHRTQMTARKGVTGLRLVMTPARSAALRLSRARPSSHSSGSSSSSSSSSSDSSSSSSGSSSEGSSSDTPASLPERLSCLSTTHSHSGTLPCRRPQVPSPAHPSGALSPVHADCLPPLKWFRGPSATSSYEGSIEDSSEASTESDIDSDILADIEADIVADAASNAGDTINIRVDVVTKPEVPDDIHVPTIAERLSKHEDVIQELYDHMLKFPTQRLADIEEEHRAQEVRAVTDETKRARLLDREELRHIRVSHYYDKESGDLRPS